MKKLSTIAMAFAFCNAAWGLPADFSWPSDIILQQPEGKVSQTYCGSEISWLLYNNQAASISGNYGICRQMVENGDDVYLKNFLLETKTDSWIKGSKQENGDILFSFPQMISDDNGRNLYLGVLTPSYDEDGTFTLQLVPDDCDMIMRWEDGVLRQVLPSTEGIEDARTAMYTGMVGAVNSNGNFVAFGEKGMSVKIWTEQPATAPQFSSTATYDINYINRDKEEVSSRVDVNFTDGQVWIQGLNRFKPEAWLVGDITDNGGWEFSFPQYNGLIDDFYTFYLGVNESVTETLDKVVFSVGEDGVLSSTGNIAVNISTEKLNPSLLFWGMTFTPVAEVAQTPMPVTDLEAEWEDDLGVIGFFLPSTDTEGRPLDMSKLYYNVYFDDELYTFTPDNDFVDEVMTDVPANYSNDLTFLEAGDGYILIVLFEPHKSVGVRCVYKNSVDTTYSEIVTCSMVTSGVESISEEPISTTYYDLRGITVAAPENGFYIRKRIMPDGSTLTDKVRR